MYRNALLCLVDAPPPGPRGGRPAPAQSPRQAAVGGRPGGAASGATPPRWPGLCQWGPQSSPPPPPAARARWHRAANAPPTPPCAALGSARRAERLRAAARHALGGGLGGFTRSAAAGAQGRPARRRQPWPWGPRAPSPGSAALPPPPPSRLPEQPGGGPLWRPSPRLGPPNFPALAARGIRPAPRAARPR